ncbi:G2/M phase-specific E3 ubiquitin-protein ligase-like isoform X2 [Glandiceps talaboti]
MYFITALHCEYQEIIGTRPVETRGKSKKKIKTEPICISEGSSDDEVTFNQFSSSPLNDTLPYVKIGVPSTSKGIPQKCASSEVVMKHQSAYSSQPHKNTIAESVYSQYSMLLHESEDEAKETDICMDGDNTVVSDLQQPSSSCEKDIRVLLQDYIDTTIGKITSTVIIWRAKLLPSMLRYVNKPSFNISNPLRVEFSGEDAEDFGGPRRELLRLLMMEVGRNMGVFEGNENAKVFSMDIQLLEDKMYRKAGKLTAMSILNGGPGLACLAKPVYEHLVGMTTTNLTLDLLQDANTREKLEELQNCGSEEHMQSFIFAHGDWVADVGYSDIYLTKLEQKGVVLNLLLKQLVLIRTSAAVNQFSQGLDDVGQLHKLMKSNPRQFMPLFVSAGEKVKRAEFKELYTVAYSEEGGNRKIKEEATVYSFEIYIEELEENQHEIGIEDLLIFMTGADRVPPLGFDKQITIDFYGMEENITRYPSSSTCDLRLWLPRGCPPEDLATLLTTAILNSQGFGKI